MRDRGLALLTLALFVIAGTGSGCESEKKTGDDETTGPECPEEGVEGCPCMVGAKCDGELVCELGLCLAPEDAETGTGTGTG